MSIVTSQEVWEAHISDPDFLKLPEEFRNTLRPHVEAMPEVLQPVVDQPFNFKTLMYAKGLFFRHCFENGFVERAEAEWPSELLDEFAGHSFMVNSIGEFLEWNLLACGFASEASDEDIAAFNAEVRASLDQHPGISEEYKALFEAGTLTIGDVLRLDPVSISTLMSLDGLDGENA